MAYVKVWWSGARGKTAGLIFEVKQLSEFRRDIGTLSRFWPASEGLKMERLHMSQEYDTWDQAFAHST